VVRNAVSSAAAAAQRIPRLSGQPAPTGQPRKEREIESWLGDLRGNRSSSGPRSTAPDQPPGKSAKATRALSDQGSVGDEPTTAIPAQSHPRTPDADSADATRAIPTQKKSDAEAATDKLNTHGKDEPQRRGGSGVSAQDLLRREGRIK
jgi:RND superfamily putative drug exporter